MSRPTREIACSSRFFGSPVISLRCSSILVVASSGVTTPHILLKVYIFERQRIQLPFIVSNGRVGEAIELGKLRNIAPYFFVVGMKNVRTIFVNINPLNVLCVNIARNVRTFCPQPARIFHEPLLHVQIPLHITHTFDTFCIYAPVNIAGVQRIYQVSIPSANSRRICPVDAVSGI